MTQRIRTVALLALLALSSLVQAAAPYVYFSFPPTPMNMGKILTPGSVTLQAQVYITNAGATVTKVEFLDGSTVIGTSTTAPYTMTWTNPSAGSHTLKARATDSTGAVGTSGNLMYTVTATNSAPSANFSPAIHGTTHSTPLDLTLGVTAGDPEANTPVTQVELLANGSVVATQPGAGYGLNTYSFTWSNVPAGTHSLTLRATDSLGASSTSAPSTITVVGNNSFPTVTLTSPVQGQTYPPSTALTLSATATDSDGSIGSVEFWVDSQTNGTGATVYAAPYSTSWNGAKALIPGQHTIWARAVDNQNGRTWSAPVTFTIAPSPTPVATITSPANGATFPVGANITLQATVTDADNNLAEFQYYKDGQPFNMWGDWSANHTATWSNVPAGTYTLTMRARDYHNNVGISPPVTITVGQAQAQVYYIQSDHLNTPRVITNSQNQVVWRNLPNTEAFGNSPVEENVSGTPFVYNLRFPGQYFDRETNTNYNYFRDYDPSTGRYVQSDPIGLKGGVNTYSYVENNPAKYKDPKGLKTFKCTKPLNAIKEKLGENAAKRAHDYVPYLYHQYSCVVDKKTGKTECGGQDHKGSPLYGEGKPSEDTMEAGECEESQPDNECFETCLKEEWAKPRPNYGIPFGTDCQNYDNDVNRVCRKKCKLKN